MANLYFRCRIVTQTSRKTTPPGTVAKSTDPPCFPDPILNALPFELSGAASRMGNYLIPDDNPQLYLKYVGQRVLWGPGTPPPPAAPLDVEFALLGHREVQGVWADVGFNASYIYSITLNNAPFMTPVDLGGGTFVQRYYLVFDPV